jgi:hypothetical protein
VVASRDGQRADRTIVDVSTPDAVPRIARQCAPCRLTARNKLDLSIVDGSAHRPGPVRVFSFTSLFEAV